MSQLQFRANIFSASSCGGKVSSETAPKQAATETEKWSVRLKRRHKQRESECTYSEAIQCCCCTPWPNENKSRESAQGPAINRNCPVHNWSLLSRRISRGDRAQCVTQAWENATRASALLASCAHTHYTAQRVNLPTHSTHPTWHRLRRYALYSQLVHGLRKHCLNLYAGLPASSDLKGT
ncbi:hypothetical protein Ciccas_007654 [Cichlidogyrus casuarinus]|uniref:Uncharacterized protein n=1 Tax=Cichlidogyrus casuarinus TaxID=1844966 RepID=A0ABD2Q2C5_9PLAT